MDLEAISLVSQAIGKSALILDSIMLCGFVCSGWGQSFEGLKGSFLDKLRFPYYMIVHFDLMDFYKLSKGKISKENFTEYFLKKYPWLTDFEYR